jgi:hypothetical protein
MTVSRDARGRRRREVQADRPGDLWILLLVLGVVVFVVMVIVDV